MKEKRDCKIIRDLLPNYIEKLTNEATNEYIEKHLEECKECNTIHENMKKEIEINTNKRDKRDKREVKYIKKFSNKLKILKIILAIILIVFIAVIGYKFIVIKSMQSKIENYKDITNFHTIINAYKGNSLEFSNIYHKDDKYLIHIKSTNEKNSKEEMINTSEGNIYLTSGEDKVAVLGGMALKTSDTVYNYLETENIGEFIINLFTSNISSVKCNNKDCYKIDNFKSSEVLYPAQGLCVYIDKETGLLVRVEKGENVWDEVFTTVTDYSYEFNIVTDEDLKEPNISEYKVQK